MSKWEELSDERRESLKKASAKYVRNHCDRLSLNLPKGTKELWSNKAKEFGFNDSLSAFIRYCVETVIASGVDDSQKSDTLVDN